MHFYEMDSDDPEATFQAMAEDLRAPSRRLAGHPSSTSGPTGRPAWVPTIIYVERPFPASSGSSAPRPPSDKLRPMAFVLVETPRPHVTLITLNRPERMNAMAFDVMIPLRQALEQVSLDNKTRVVVLTGAGHGFCSGADQEDAGIIPHIDGLTVPTIALRAMELLDDVIRALRRMHQPVIAAINGAAIGGGFCLILATDIRVASEAAYFRAAGINNGLTSTELGLSYLLPRAIGSSRAFEIMLTGRDVDAAEADRIGLVSGRPPDQLLDAAYEVADRIASFSRPGIELTKRSCGPASRPAASRATWTPRARPNSSSASPPRTSKRPSGPARRSVGPSSGTDPRRPSAGGCPRWAGSRAATRSPSRAPPTASSGPPRRAVRSATIRSRGRPVPSSAPR